MKNFIASGQKDIKFMVRMRSLDVVNFFIAVRLVHTFPLFHKSEKFWEKDYKVKCMQWAY